MKFLYHCHISVFTSFNTVSQVISQSAYDGCADVWSAGITAIELCKGAPPYANRIHPFQATLLIPKVRRMSCFVVEVSFCIFIFILHIFSVRLSLTSYSFSFMHLYTEPSSSPRGCVLRGVQGLRCLLLGEGPRRAAQRRHPPETPLHHAGRGGAACLEGLHLQ